MTNWIRQSLRSLTYSLAAHRIQWLESEAQSTWVTAYSDDVMAYIPSRRVLREGGYEGSTSMIYYGLPTTWSPEIEEIIIEQALKPSVK